MSVIIETPTDDKLEWGVSFTSHNPEPQDYVECASYLDAERLHIYLSASQAREAELREKLEEVSEFSIGLKMAVDASHLKLAEQQAVLRLVNTAFDRTATEVRSGYLSGGSVEVSDLRVEAWRAVANCDDTELRNLLEAVRDKQREEDAAIVRAFEPDDIDLYNAILRTRKTDSAASHETDLDMALRHQ